MVSTRNTGWPPFLRAGKCVVSPPKIHHCVNVAYYIAKRVSGSGRGSFSRLILRIAVAAVALSVCVMIVAAALITGFKQEISEKIFGFWGHIHITDTNALRSFLEPAPVDKQQEFYPYLDTVDRVPYLDPTNIFGQESDTFRERITRGGVRHVQVFALKPGIIKSKEQIEGIILKGIGDDFDWTFFNDYLVTGEPLVLNEDRPSNGILISKYTADRLSVAVGDKFIVHFVQNNDQLRRAFQVKGIYSTGLQDYDSKTALVDIRKIQQLLGWTEDQVGGFEVFIDDLADLDALTDYIYYERIAGDLYATSIRNKFPTIFEWLELQNINEVVILSLMVVVSIINMITALMILILERTKMIGTLKALGGTDWTIRQIFLYYSAYILLLGLLWGNLIGLGLCFAQETFGFIQLSEEDYYLSTAPIAFDWGMFLLINAGTVIITLLFLLLPTYLVTHIDPVKALRFQ